MTSRYLAERFRRAQPTKQNAEHFFATEGLRVEDVGAAWEDSKNEIQALSRTPEPLDAKDLYFEDLLVFDAAM